MRDQEGDGLTVPGLTPVCPIQALTGRRRPGWLQSRRDDEQTTPPESFSGFQGKGGSGCREGRQDAGRTGAAVRCPSQPDYGLEGSAPGGGCRGVRFGAEIGTGPARRRCQDVARQDRRADAHQRFFVRCAQQSRPAERKAMIDRSHPLPLTRQAKALGISRGRVYDRPRPVPTADLAIMRRMDELHLEFPFAGSRMLRDLLNQEGIEIGRCHVATLMKRMGLEALYRKPNTSKPTPGHKIYPYLLRGVSVDRPNQAWAMDITYAPMARGFVYLAAVVDWFSRRVLSWRVSITLEAAFCVEALEEALARHGRPEIFNTDQGSQFTSHDFTDVRLKAGVAISLDGRGSWRDNVFVERLWRSIKYEEVYLRAYDTVSEARASIGRYLAFYNGRRPHSSLDRRTPDQAYFTPLPQIAVA